MVQNESDMGKERVGALQSSDRQGFCRWYSAPFQMQDQEKNGRPGNSQNVAPRLAALYKAVGVYVL